MNLAPLSKWYPLGHTGILKIERRKSCRQNINANLIGIYEKTGWIFSSLNWWVEIQLLYRIAEENGKRNDDYRSKSTSCPSYFSFLLFILLERGCFDFFSFFSIPNLRHTFGQADVFYTVFKPRAIIQRLSRLLLIDYFLLWKRGWI